MPLPKVRQLSIYIDFETGDYEELDYRMGSFIFTADYDSEGFDKNIYYTDVSSDPSRILPPLR